MFAFSASAAFSSRSTLWCLWSVFTQTWQTQIWHSRQKNLVTSLFASKAIADLGALCYNYHSRSDFHLYFVVLREDSTNCFAENQSANYRNNFLLGYSLVPDNRDIEIVLVFGFSKRVPLNISSRRYEDKLWSLAWCKYPGKWNKWHVFRDSSRDSIAAKADYEITAKWNTPVYCLWFRETSVRLNMIPFYVRLPSRTGDLLFLERMLVTQDVAWLFNDGPCSVRFCDW